MSLLGTAQNETTDLEKITRLALDLRNKLKKTSFRKTTDGLAG